MICGLIDRIVIFTGSDGRQSFDTYRQTEVAINTTVVGLVCTNNVERSEANDIEIRFPSEPKDERFIRIRRLGLYTFIKGRFIILDRVVASDIGAWLQIAVRAARDNINGLRDVGDNTNGVGMFLSIEMAHFTVKGNKAA